MKTDKVLRAWCILLLAGILISWLTGPVYARHQIGQRACIDVRDTSNEHADDQVDAQSDKTVSGKDKASPYHAWKAFAGEPVDSIIDLERLRNWAPSTVYKEGLDLVRIGVLATTDAEGNKLPEGQYRILISAKAKEIKQINEEVISVKIVDRKGIHNEDLGLDSYNLGPTYLGKGDKDVGQQKINDIKRVIERITKTEIKPTVGEDVEEFSIEQAINNKESLPVSVFINKEKLSNLPNLTIGGLQYSEYEGIKELTDQEKQVLLANLVDLGLLSNTATPAGEGVYNIDFTDKENKSLVFLRAKEDVVEATPKELAEKVSSYNDNTTVVIIPGEENRDTIMKALELAKLTNLWGSKIKIMEQMNAAAKSAFKEFFDPNYSPAPKKAEDILKDRTLMKALGHQG